jgi:hypothetical protein
MLLLRGLMLLFLVVSLRGVRWAYVTYVGLALLYFPARVGFHLSPHACELAFDLPLAIFSLSNYPHIMLLAAFFVLTSLQLRMDRPRAYLWAGLATLAMGALIEVAEGVTGRGNCRLRDLVPDSEGALLGATLVFPWNRVRILSRSGQDRAAA